MSSMYPLLSVVEIRGWFPPWLAAALGVAAVALAALLYFRESASVPSWRRFTLAGIRAVTLIVIAILLLRPTVVVDTYGSRPRPIVLLVDDSQSMTVAEARTNFLDRWRLGIALDRIAPDAVIPAMPSAADLPDGLPDSVTRLELGQAVLTNPRLNLLDRLGQVGPLWPATFGLRPTAKDPRSLKWVHTLSGIETSTALADSVAESLRKDELPAAIVVVTDGRDNASESSFDELAHQCSHLGVPLHIYGVGSSSFGQAYIKDVAAAETLFVDDVAAIPVRYKITGFRGGQVEILVRLRGPDGGDGKIVAGKTFDAREGDDLRETLAFVPDKSDADLGRQELVTTLRATVAGETVTDEMVKSVRVVDRKLKVLVVDSTPRWDFKFLQRSLLRDRRVESRFFLFEGDPRAMRSGDPFVSTFPVGRAELFAYDLLVLGDIPASQLTREQQEYVREFVTEGGGLIHAAGRNHGPASFVGNPLADVLPVEIPARQFPIDSGDRPAAFRPQLTPTGLRSPILTMGETPEISRNVWQTLPEIYWCYPVKRLKPAAESFLAHPTENDLDGKPMPLLAGHYYGKGYVLYLGFDETWRWRLNEADKYFGRFWTQAVYVAGVPRTYGTKLTQLSLDTTDPQIGKVGQVYARLLTPELQPMTAAQIEGRLERLDAGPDDPERFAPVELKALPGQPGEYIATVPFNRVGRFALRVDAGFDSVSLDYRVSLPPEHELSPGGMAEERLRNLAEASGGRFYHEEELLRLPDAIEPKLVSFSRRDEILLWNRWALILVIGLLTTEWFFRKLCSLS